MSHSVFASRHMFGTAWTLALGAVVVLGASQCRAQQGSPYDAPAAPLKAAPANAQLASPQIEKRVDDLLRQMTLDEKLGQLVQYGDTTDSASAALASDAQAPGKNPETHIKIDPMQLASTGRLGTMLNTVGAAHTHTYQQARSKRAASTSRCSSARISFMAIAPFIRFRWAWPPPSIPSSPNRSPMSAEEAVTAGVRWFYSPMVDISRDPRWGRTQEGAGEDPYLGAAMARAYIHGYQGDDLSKPGSVAASGQAFCRLWRR